jgi:hypothetical protein
MNKVIVLLVVLIAAVSAQDPWDTQVAQVQKLGAQQATDLPPSAFIVCSSVL